MGNFKVRVNSEAESREIQNILESKGFKKWEGWSELGSIGGFIWTDSDKTYCDNRIEYFDESPRKEITLAELRAMVNPINEYLEPLPNGEYKYHSNLSAVGGEWLEIPEGAECLTRCKDHNDDEWLLFWKGDHKFCVGHDKEWFYFESGVSEYLSDWCGLANIIWQRDQYAEIEQVRDNVNNPQHYNKGGVECIDAIEASMTPEAFKGYLKGNVQKYMWRYEQKGGVESLRKAQWYLERLVASMGS